MATDIPDVFGYLLEDDEDDMNVQDSTDATDTLSTVSDAELDDIILSSEESPLTEEVYEHDTTATVGVIDNKKKQVVQQRQQKALQNNLFLRWIEQYLNSIYKTYYTSTGNVKILKGNEGGFINMDTNNMVMYDEMIVDLWDSGVPPLLVFYHEIGHLLYTSKDLVTLGSSLNKSEFNLLNWLEDFFIEDKLCKELYYIKPYIKMLHEVVPDFIDDWQKPRFAFNYYYAFEGQTPMWMSQTTPPIDKTFENSIKTLLTLRRSINSRFGQQRFLNEFQKFYMFCVTNGILEQHTPPPPTQPQPPQPTPGGGQGQQGQGQPGNGSGRGTGGAGTANDVDLSGTGQSTNTTMGGTIVDPNDVDQTYAPAPVNMGKYKPLDPVKGFANPLKDLMIQLVNELDKQLYNDYKLAKKGKQELVPRARNTSSPRSMVDPVAIATNSESIYLEYVTEEVNYVGYNLFIDASGSVGYNTDYNTGCVEIVKIIKNYTYNVYTFNDKLVKLSPVEIGKLNQLSGTGGTESSLIASIVLEKREANNLNIVFSDGDLSYLISDKQFNTVKNKYLFVFFCVYDPVSYEQNLSNYLDPKQFFCYKDAADLPKGLDKLKQYIKTKGA